MLTLALESTTVTASAALCRDGMPLAQISLHVGNTHSVTLLPMIQKILQDTKYSIRDLDLLACSVGPGSFTGIRIGVATLKGLAFAQDIPCVGVSSVKALAYRLRIVNGIVCPLIGARRTQYYSALFRIQDGNVMRLTEDRVVLEAELPAILSEYREPVYLTGDGYESAAASLSHPYLCQTPPALRAPDAVSVAECACELYHKAENTSAFTAESLSPVYLRKTQAEQEREERLKGAVSQ